MAFNMAYSFEGNPKPKPEQNLAGASRKLSKDTLLKKIHEERQKRLDCRLKLQSIEYLQTQFRSYLTRKHAKQERRLVFDSLPDSELGKLLSNLLFFYDRGVDDFRLVRVCKIMLDTYSADDVNLKYRTDYEFQWLLKRWLHICLKSCQNSDINEPLLRSIERFTSNGDLLVFLIYKNYYDHLCAAFNTCRQEHDLILALVGKPFQFCRTDDVFARFCDSFLFTTFTPNLRQIFVAFLKCNRFPFEDLLRYLNQNKSHLLSCNGSLLRTLFALEPEQYAPNIDYMQILAHFTFNLHSIVNPNWDTNSSDDDEDDNASVQMQPQNEVLEDFLTVLNDTERVKKIIDVMRNTNDELFTSATTMLCHNLLLVSSEAIWKYSILYQLGLDSDFLNVLWKKLLLPSNSNILLKSLLSSLSAWQIQCHGTLSVFCDLFSFYTEILTESENTDTTETFTDRDLHNMCNLLRNVSLNLVQIAFPMSRSSSVIAIVELKHLYHTCIGCLRLLYNLDLRRHFCPTKFWTSRKVHISHDPLRTNSMASEVQPFSGIVITSEDTRVAPLSTIEQRSLAILHHLPFLLSFNVRVHLMRSMCRSIPNNEFNYLMQSFSGNGSTVVIRRTHLYEDAFEKLSSRDEAEFKQRLRIQFVNNLGLHEAGIDGGGIFKEFINETLKTAFDPNRGFFLLTAENTLYPNPSVHLLVENFADHYNFIGRLVGKALLENVLVDLPLAEFFRAKLLIGRVSVHFLQSLDPLLYRNLLYLRDYKGDVSDLGLDFTIIHNDLGETRVIELKPNGRQISVTNDNRLEYIQRLANLKLNSQLRRQCAAFCDGLNSVIPLQWLRLFNYQEMQILISGAEQSINVEDLRAHTVYNGEFNAEHDTIKLFWKVLGDFTEDQKKGMLKFVTSCSRPPLLGFKELNPNFCIQSTGREDRLPTASTCLNLLKIPIITDENILRYKLLEAIEQQAGFELS